MLAAPKVASVSPSDDGMRRGALATNQGNAFGWDSKLRKADEFSSVFRFKRVLREAHLDIFFRQNGLDHSRLGLVVSKRVLARAVDRNRTKRVIREAFRLSQHELGGLDVVVRVKVAGLSADYRAEWALFKRRFSPAK
ncbi:MAG: ribonuclease P protein component [Parasulfuritortus sp.]|nr:ribonuclease P protein component [Parasulfuritortus sp.]